MPALVLLLVCLATYRMTRLLVADAFPPIAWLRGLPARRFGEDSSLAYLAECPWCASVYVAAAVVAGVDVASDLPVVLPALQVFTASAVAGLIASLEP